MVQHNAAKFASNTYPRKGHYDKFSISNVLDNLNWKTLEERRSESRLCMAYNIINNKVILDPSLLPKSARPLRKCNGNTNLKHQLQEHIPRLEVTGKTFFLSIPRLWNQRVTETQASATSIDAFKRHFNK